MTHVYISYVVLGIFIVSLALAVFITVQKNRKLLGDNSALENKVRSCVAELVLVSERLGMAFSSMIDGLFMLDSDLNYLFFNERYLDILRLPSGLVVIGGSVDPVIKYLIRRGDFGVVNEEACMRECLQQLRDRGYASQELITPFGPIIECRQSPAGDDRVVVTFTDITIRKQDEERLQLALEGGNMGFWDVNLETGITVFDARYAEIFGYPPGSLKSDREDFIQQIHPDDRERVLEIEQDYLAGKIATYEVECRVFRPDGGIVWAASKGAAVTKFDNGLVTRLVGVAQDITQRKHMEQVLFESEKKFRVLLESAPDPMLVANTAGLITIFNRQAEQLFGYQREEVLGQLLEMLIPMAFRTHHVQLRDEYLTNPQPKPMAVGRTLHVQTKNGQNIPVEVNLSPIETSDGLLVISSLRDISSRQQMEKKLAEQQRRLCEKRDFLQNILDQSPVGVAISTRNIISFANLRFTQMFDAFAGDSFVNVFANHTDWNLINDLLNQHDGMVSHEVKMLDCHRQERDISGTYLVTTFDGRQGVLCWLSDITEHKEVEIKMADFKEMADAANRAKSEFLANMDHEIRTPIKAMIGMSHLVLQTDLTDSQRNYVTNIHHSAESLLGIIEASQGRIAIPPI